MRPREVAEGEAGVEDVFDEDDVAAFDGVVDVFDELDGAGGDAGTAVAGDGDEVEGVVDLDGSGEVGEEDGGAFEDADEYDGLAGAVVVGGDLLADGMDAIGDLLLGVEDLHGRGGRERQLTRGHEVQGSANGGWKGKRGGMPVYFKRARLMYPYIDIGAIHLGTFGLMLWLAAVAGTVVLHKNFVRNGVDGDALSVVALVVIAGVLGAKTWHELQNVDDLRAAMRMIVEPGWAHPMDVGVRFLHWFQAGFAWFGGMLAGIAMLMWQGRQARFLGPLRGTLGQRIGAVRMLDLAAPATAIGYGVGRIGCLTSGDGDYGRNTTEPLLGCAYAA